MQISVCRLAIGNNWQSVYTLVYYSHLIPISIALLLSTFVLIKSKYSFLSKIYTLFTVGFCAWLAGDTIVWTSTNFNLMAFVWAPLDYINIIFYLSGAYFFFVLVRGKDISFWQKIILFSLSLPAWWISLTNQSIAVWYQPMCQANNNEFLTQYKLYIEVIVTAVIILYTLYNWRKFEWAKKLQILIVSFALVLFFSIFGVTEYISSQTGNYNINLYSLFILPVFLFLIIYSITNLEIFKTRLLGFQLLAYVLVIMVGSQFFFITDTTNKTLTALTFVLSLGFGMLLVRSGKREEAARIKVEKLAADLEAANSQKNTVLHLVAHQLNGPVSIVRGLTELMIEGDYGQLNDEQKGAVVDLQKAGERIKDHSEMILDAAKITTGKLPLEPAPLDLNELFKAIIDEAKTHAKERNVSLHVSLPSSPLPKAILDRKFTQLAIDNLLSNAIKYTAKKLTDGSGNVDFTVECKDQILYCSVKDNGIGIPEADKDKMFKELSRGSNAGREGNGLGLHVAKGAIESQDGKIRFESKENEGTTFFVELPLKIAPKN